MAKRILIYTLTYLPFTGGAEIALKEIIKRIPAEEIDFDIVTLRFDRSLPKVEVLGNTTIYRLGFTAMTPQMADLYRLPLSLNKYLFPFLALWKGALLQKKKGYDAVWSVMANYAGFAALFFKFIFPHVKFLLTLQEGDPPEHIRRRVRFVYPLFRLIFKKADAVQAISSYLADFARAEGSGVRPVVVPNGVDLERFSRQPDPAAVSRIQKELGRKPGETFLITASRLVHKNGIDDLIMSLLHLPPEVRLVVAGSGPDDWKLKLAAIDNKVNDRVHFVGHVKHRDLPEYFAACDMFVRPSRSEGMGNAFIEAMAAGLPVIAAPVGGVVDFLFDPEKNPKHEPTGLFCAVDDPKSIADAVQRLISDKALRERLIENGRTLATARYGWDHVVSKMRKKVFAPLLKS